MINWLNYSLRGYYSYEIINASNGEVERRSPPKNNLILNQGMNGIATRPFADNFLACAIGTSSTAPLLTDTQLGNETERTIVYNTDEGYCGSTLNTSSLSIFRTFKFPTFINSVFRGEIGWSHSSVAGANLYSKAILVDENGNPGPVLIPNGRFIQVKYTLEITFSPATPTAVAPNFVGRTASDGVANVQYLGIKSIDSDGLTVNYDLGSGVNEPSVAGSIFLSTGTGALADFGSGINRLAGANAKPTSFSQYISNSFTVSKYANFGKNEGTGNAIRSIGIGPATGSALNSTYVHLFDTNQEKLQDYIWGIYFNYTWTRT